MEDLEMSNATATAPDSYLKGTGTRIATSHIHHCFDYLRQALMCAADTNLEVLDRETRLTDGWGSERKCRDYQGVSRWAEEWRDSEDVGIVTK